MFRKLRIRFIGIASLSILIVLVSIVGIINSVNYYQMRQDTSKVLSILSQNNGSFPSISETTSELGDSVSEDTLFQYRYFSAFLDSNGDISSLNTTNISDLSASQVEKYVNELGQSSKNSGDFKHNGHTYAYLVTTVSKKKTLIVVLDITNQVNSYQDLIRLTLWLSSASFFFFVVVVSLFSGKVIQPFVENYEKQRRFITNAGHELKTPLAIISANNELVEMMNGESEWTKSTTDQVRRLTGLINKMVSLARLEEQPEIVLSNLNFSAIVEDAAEDFKGPVIKDGKNFKMEIQPDIHVKAEENSLFELVTLLVDNANKYCDPNGSVTVKLSKANKLAKARLEISNTYATGKNVDYSKFFERFYREDESHSNINSGYGIGLSMAENMVKLFKGSISVSYKDETISFIVLL